MATQMQASLDIGWLALTLFMLVLLVPLGIGRLFNLKLGGEMLLAAARMTAQLLLVGFYLKFLFSLESLWVNLLWLSVMLLVGASAILGGARLPKARLMLPLLFSLSLSLLPLLALLLLALLQPTPLYQAQYMIPLAGMLLGNSLSGNILALQRLFNAFEEKQEDYQGRLALGATPWQAAFPFIQGALQQALAPSIAAMGTMGLVTLPGMMTGQILGGSDPLVAVKYQVVIMLAILVMLSLSVASALSLAVRQCLNHSGKLLIKRVDSLKN
ncbi:ABC transporter permease [Shewanella sp. KCT]|uniref:ABC transporter permease n=1 Tax=Shewanella sp. KCT TaxID=2569535 RepID=UPI0021B34BA1|nr:iron export ABC transporter permease subunit FetB [Shewanella sp. KCT]